MRKISKGHYTTIHQGVEFDVINVREIVEGDCNWSIEFIDYELGLDIFNQTQYDQLYRTKTEAMEIAKHIIEQYISIPRWNAECHGY